MEMRARHSTRSADDTNLLAALDGIADANRRLRQVEVACHHAGAMVDVHDIARQKEVVHEDHDSPVRRAHRIARLPGEIDAAVAACESAVEQPPRTEATRYARA